MTYNRCVALLMWLAAVPMAVAVEPAASDKIVAEVISNNADLKARRAEMRSAGLLNAAENRLVAPDVDMEHQWGQSGVGNKWSVGVSQSFDWPGAYGARRTAARKADAAMMAVYDNAAFDLAVEVRGVLVDIVSVKQRKAAVAEMAVNLKTVKENTARAFEYGEATVLEMNKLDLQLFALETKMESLDCELIALEERLNALNGGAVAGIAALDYCNVGELLPESRYMELADAHDTRLAALRADIEAKRSGADVARMMRYPGFSVGYVHNVEIGEHFNGVRFGVSLPMFTGGHRERAALLEAEAAEYSLDAYRAQLHAGIVSDYATAVKLKGRVDERRGLFTDGKYAEALSKAFNGGQMGLLDYLYELNFYIESKFDYIDLVARYRKLLAGLNRYSAL